MSGADHPTLSLNSYFVTIRGIAFGSWFHKLIPRFYFSLNSGDTGKFSIKLNFGRCTRHPHSPGCPRRSYNVLFSYLHLYKAIRKVLFLPILTERYKDLVFGSK